MKPDLLDILRHSLGLERGWQGTFSRNRFVTGAGSKDHASCMELTAIGYMTRRAKVELFGGDDIFTVTEEGKLAAVKNSQPPKLSRGQQRYQEWLNYDGSMSFIEYLKWKSQRQQQMGNS